MINKISFAGKVYYLGDTKLLSQNKPKEIKRLKHYADKADCDMVVLDRDYYADDTGKYKVLLSKVDNTTGKNIFSKAIFDFKKGTVEVHSAKL